MWLLSRYIRDFFVTHTCPAESCKMILIVRSDITMGKGKTAGQCAHAAVECYQRALIADKKMHLIRPWLNEGQPKIVLKISGEEELITLERNARQSGLITAIIRDAGISQLRPGTISVLAIGPGPKTLIEPLTMHLKLL